MPGGFLHGKGLGFGLGLRLGFRLAAPGAGVQRHGKLPRILPHRGGSGPYLGRFKGAGGRRVLLRGGRLFRRGFRLGRNRLHRGRLFGGAAFLPGRGLLLLGPLLCLRQLFLFGLLGLGPALCFLFLLRFGRRLGLPLLPAAQQRALLPFFLFLFLFPAAAGRGGLLQVVQGLGKEAAEVFVHHYLVNPCGTCCRGGLRLGILPGRRSGISRRRGLGFGIFPGRGGRLYCRSGPGFCFFPSCRGRLHRRCRLRPGGGTPFRFRGRMERHLVCRRGRRNRCVRVLLGHLMQPPLALSCRRLHAQTFQNAVHRVVGSSSGLVLPQLL